MKPLAAFALSFTFAVSFILGPTVASAATFTSQNNNSSAATAPMTTKQQAELEMSQSLKGVRRASPSEVQVTGILQMQTSELRQQGRDWTYTLGLSAAFTGINLNQQSSQFKIDDSFSKPVMPILSFGFMNHSEGPHFGVMADLGFASQTTSAKFASGLLVNDFKVNTTYLALMGLGQLSVGQMDYLAKAGIATTMITQSSTNSTLTDFESPSLAVLGLAAAYNFTKTYSLVADLRANNYISGDPRWKLDSTSLALGVSAKW